MQVLSKNINKFEFILNIFNFFRLCAVFGGTYCLNRPVNSVILNSENKCLSVICGEQRISADNFIIGTDNIPSKFLANSKQEKISRAIFITDK